MPVRIGRMTSEVVAPEVTTGPDAGADRDTQWERRAIHRATEARLAEDRARTRARGFDD